MPRTDLARYRMNLANGTTLVGRLIAAFAGRRSAATGEVVRANKITIVGGYARRMPAQDCFTVGNMIFCRHDAGWLIDRPELLGHESRHCDQYATFGPFFFPLYFLFCGWSYVLTGDYGSRNHFERKAGLAAGGYADLPLRPIWLRLFGSPRPKGGPLADHQVAEADAVAQADPGPPG